MIKHFIASAVCMLGCSFQIFAQDEPAQPDSAAAVESPWTFRYNAALTLTQTSFSNWQAGGENTWAGNVLMQSNINYKKGNNSWDNLILGNYGIVSRESGAFKTDDRFEINSRYDRKTSEHWNLSALINFRTQFMDGFADEAAIDPISRWLAPAYGVAGLGFTYKKGKIFNVYLSPVTAKLTVVNDERLSNLGVFGVTAGERTRWEGGGYLNMIYQNQFLKNKNIDFLTKLDLFSNYFENPLAIDVNWETIIFYKINKYFTVNLAFHLIYDEDIRFNLDTNGDGQIDRTNVPRTQFRNLFGLGISYTFTNKKEG
ncbi:MAG: DUF3078 domain-containing protein [Schleiferiaceae bacterium]|nr:DUF3078 domain-containing protein [Schleiferiaceae bacterium]